MRKWKFKDLQVNTASWLLVFWPDPQHPSTDHTSLLESSV